MSKVPTRNRAARVFVISDLHVGGRLPHMMSRPDRLASFIRSLPARKDPDEDLELVIAGDFVDFLAIPEFEAFTEDPVKACEKLSTVMDAEPFEQVFVALAGLVAEHRLTILVGNHDLELALPSVQEALLTKLQAGPHQVLFVDDGRAYRIGRALIEHGNRYDPANLNDWDGLRAIASAQSRGEPAALPLRASTGSQIVYRIINKLKEDYPFVDLLQPEGHVRTLLEAEFEPRIASQLKFVGSHIKGTPHLARAAIARSLHPQGARPDHSRNIAAVASNSAIPHDPKLEAIFGENYKALQAGSRDISAGVWPALSEFRQEGLSHLLKTHAPIPSSRLNRIREALALVQRSTSLNPETLDSYAVAAQRFVHDDVCDVVVMGHTHEAREYFWKGERIVASYINTGTWADVVQFPDDVLAANDEIFRGFLESLFVSRPNSTPTYAEMRVDAAGSVNHARVGSFQE